MRFQAKITWSCISVDIAVDWVILVWYACAADRQGVWVRSRGHENSHQQDRINEVRSIRYKFCEQGRKVTFLRSFVRAG